MSGQNKNSNNDGTLIWRDYFKMSPTAVKLEQALAPTLIEHHKGLASTANTDIDERIINLDVSQAPLKTALSYAYELKNLENAGKYAEINKMAERRAITKLQYIQMIIDLEAEAAIFRCRVYRDLEIDNSDVPFKRDYLKLYDANINLPMRQLIHKFALYILENGVVRQEHTVKKYYSACYDSLAGKNHGLVLMKKDKFYILTCLIKAKCQQLSRRLLDNETIKLHCLS